MNQFKTVILLGLLGGLFVVAGGMIGGTERRPDCPGFCGSHEHRELLV